MLARAGCRVALVERTDYASPRVGETLPPEVRLLLDRLGVWDRFLGDGHTPSPGILAAWGQPDPHANDFVLNPHGPGWRVDRARFDAMLAAAAEGAGAVVHRRADVLACERQRSGGWHIVVGDRRTEDVSAGFVVDAAGRGSSVRRRLGGRTVVHDRLVALTAVLTAAPEFADRRALIEATEHGWWYSARLPDGAVVVAFHTDPAPGLRNRWPALLASAPHTAARVGGRAATGLRHVAANTQRRQPEAGDGWLAVGDAAAAHDPIAGLGVYWALESGLAAADAILAGDGTALMAYADARRSAFADYLVRRTTYYRAEGRWHDAPFWQARRAG